MKTYRNATFVAALITFSCTVHAQSSSVTLYGITDVGVVYNSNVKTASGGKNLWQMLSGNESGSRWGLLGTEDLGGGLKALFRIESGFNINNGTLAQGGRMFGRQSYVGVKDENFGTFLMGRQLNAIQDFLAPLQAQSAMISFSTHPLDNDNLNNTYRTDNVVKYSSPNIGGFSAEATYGFSNATNFANNRAYSFGATYTKGTLNLGAAYARAQSPGAIGGAIVGNPSSATPSNPLLGAARVDQWGAGGAYAFGPATVGVLYTGSLYTNSATALAAARGTIHFHNYEANLRYALTPAVILALAETYTSVHQSAGSGHYLQTSVGADYFLSKRTNLYFDAFYQKASKNLNANIDGAGGAASGTSQAVVALGIRHKF
ncbi:porin [Burkholderia cepacia]|uniref:porin n=1 Tax=Burkholderia cepacia TaxID=292 RepID=UPI002AB669B8|nr:porin [Burkholderia cepacia]